MSIQWDIICEIFAQHYHLVRPHKNFTYHCYIITVSSYIHWISSQSMPHWRKMSISNIRWEVTYNCWFTTIIITLKLFFLRPVTVNICFNLLFERERNRNWCVHFYSQNSYFTLSIQHSGFDVKTVRKERIR